MHINQESMRTLWNLQEQSIFLYWDDPHFLLSSCSSYLECRTIASSLDAFSLSLSRQMTLFIPGIIHLSALLPSKISIGVQVNQRRFIEAPVTITKPLLPPLCRFSGYLCKQRCFFSFQRGCIFHIRGSAGSLSGTFLLCTWFFLYSE